MNRLTVCVSVIGIGFGLGIGYAGVRATFPPESPVVSTHSQTISTPLNVETKSSKYLIRMRIEADNMTCYVYRTSRQTFQCFSDFQRGVGPEFETFLNNTLRWNIQNSKNHNAKNGK